MKSYARQIFNILRFKSNLAFALILLPPKKRRDMLSFYKFCRIVDDIADDENLSVAAKESQLGFWHIFFSDKKLSQASEISNTTNNANKNSINDWRELCEELQSIIEKYNIPEKYFADILAGVKSDLTPQSFVNFAELEKYCYHVAGAVGIVSSYIFGCRQSGSRDYALVLGNALQFTNIIRDVGEDADNGRIYLPKDLLERFGMANANHGNIQQFAKDKLPLALNEMANKAEFFFKEAEEILPESEQKNFKSARLMARIYQNLLARMRADNFQVFAKRYAPSKVKMLYYLLSTKN